MSRRFHPLVLVLISVTSPLALGREAGEAVPIAEVISSTRTSSPAVVTAKMDVEISALQARQALSLQLPHVSLSDRQTYRYNNPEAYTYDYYGDSSSCVPTADEPCPPPYVVVEGQVQAPEDLLSNALSLSVFQPLIAPRQVVAIMQSRERAETSAISVEGKEQQAVLDVVNAYFQMQALLSQKKVELAQLALSKEVEVATRGALKTGQTTQLDADRAQLDREMVEQKLRQLDEEMSLAASELARISGTHIDSPLRVCQQSPLAGGNKALALDNSTRVLMSAQQVEMERLGLAAARTSLLPTLNLMGGVTWSGAGQDMTEQFVTFQYDHWFVGANLSLSLFDGLSRYHGSESARLEYDQAQRKLDDDRQQVKAQDQRAAQQLGWLDEQLRLLDRSITLSEAQVGAMKARFLAGTATWEMYTQARQLLEMQYLQRVALIQQEWQIAALRWIGAGQMEPLISLVTFTDDRRSDEGACQVVLASFEEQQP